MMMKFLTVPWPSVGVKEQDYYTSLTNVLYVESAGNDPTSNVVNVWYTTNTQGQYVEIYFNENQIDNEGMIWFQNLVETALREDYTKVIYEVENLPPNLTINQTYTSG